jgi:lipoprotein-releasing system permease protein
MERVATIATAVGLAVIIVTLSVVIGFKQNLGALISGVSSDIVVTAPQSRGVVSAVGLERSAELESLFESDDIIQCSSFTSKEGVLKSDDNIVGVLLKGVDTLYDSSFYTSKIIEGMFPRIGEEPRTKDILISQRMAEKMDVEVGERIEMLFLDYDGGVLRDRFLISGVYNTGVDILDDRYVITDMRNVARLYDGDSNVVTGYELWLDKDTDKYLVAEHLNEEFMTLYFDTGIQAEAYTMEDIFPQVFGWLATHDITALVVIVIMLVVALLNMATALLIIVLERERMIGELRALGMRRSGVVRLFLYRSLFIVARGVAWGVAIGLIVVLVQHTWSVIPLPAEGYLLDAVPTAMCWGWWIAMLIVVVAVTLLFMLLPATLSARISPAETMRYE